MSNNSSTDSLEPQEVTSTMSSITVASETSQSTSSTLSPNPTPIVTTSSTVAPTTVSITSPNTSPPPPTLTPSPSAQPPSVTTTSVPNPPNPPTPPQQPTQPSNPPPKDTPPDKPLPPATSPATPPDSSGTITQTTPNKTVAPSLVTVTLSPTSPGGPSVVTIIQTSTHAGNPDSKSTASQSSLPTSTSVPLSDQSRSSNNGLSGNRKISVAVIVPLLAVTLIVLGTIFLYRRRKQRKHAEQLRRKEVEEYGYNPNQDPTFPVIGSLSGNDSQEMREENTGYRGWGATAPAPGKMDSNHMAKNSNSAVTGIGMAYSEGETPTHGTMSDTKSDNPLISELNTSSISEQDPMGIMGPAAAGNRVSDINRGSSNASSSYSAANRSDESGEISGRYFGQQYSPDGYSGVPHNLTAGRAEMPAQPVIRDVQARRNTRIENPSHFPQQSTGISQNF